MKVYTNIYILFGMLFLASIAQGQITYKKYIHTRSQLQLNTAFIPVSNGFISSSKTNHIFLNTLNSQFVDTTKNKINAFSIPTYTPIKKNALTNPSSAVNQFIGAMLPCGYYFPSTLYGLNTYGSYKRTSLGVPYSSPYNIKAGSPYYILPKF